MVPGIETGRARQQGGHAGDVAVFLAGTVGVAEHHLVDPLNIEPRRPLDGLADHVGSKVIGTDAARPEPNLPKGVRTASYTKAWFMGFPLVLLPN